jgi:hypothetical protein
VTHLGLVEAAFRGVSRRRAERNAACAIVDGP